MSGWFDKEGLWPLKININGCTVGGSAIKVDIVVADGLHGSLGTGGAPAGFASSMWFDLNGGE